MKVISTTYSMMKGQDTFFYILYMLSFFQCSVREKSKFFYSDLEGCKLRCGASYRTNLNPSPKQASSHSNVQWHVTFIHIYYSTAHKQHGCFSTTCLFLPYEPALKIQNVN
jgi:hypothetical protein